MSKKNTDQISYQYSEDEEKEANTDDIEIQKKPQRKKN